MKICNLDSTKDVWDHIKNIHKSDSISLEDELSYNEDDSFSTTRAMLAITDLPIESEEELSSNDDGDEEVEDIDDAFNKLYLKSLELAKENSRLRMKNLELKDKYTFLQSKLEELGKSLEEKKTLEKTSDDFLRRNEIMEMKIHILED